MKKLSFFLAFFGLICVVNLASADSYCNLDTSGVIRIETADLCFDSTYSKCQLCAEGGINPHITTVNGDSSDGIYTINLKDCISKEAIGTIVHYFRNPYQVTVKNNSDQFSISVGEKKDITFNNKNYTLNYDTKKPFTLVITGPKK